MARLIDADALDMYECLRSYYGDAWRDAQKAIDDAPTVDPIKHEHWKEHKDYPGLAYLCSGCGYFTTDRSYYCPNCGAKMEVEDGKID